MALIPKDARTGLALSVAVTELVTSDIGVPAMEICGAIPVAVEL
jgi:hypothetical protein